MDAHVRKLFTNAKSAIDKCSPELWQARYDVAKNFCDEKPRTYTNKQGETVTFAAKDLVPSLSATLFLPAVFKSKSASKLAAEADSDILELVKLQQAIEKPKRSDATPRPKRKRTSNHDSSAAAESHSAGDDEEDAVLAALETAREGYEQVRASSRAAHIATCSRSLNCVCRRSSAQKTSSSASS